jgi:putative endopeptidase
MSELIKPNAPISWNVMPDLKHPEIVRNYINIPPANYGGLDQLITIFDTDDAATIKRKKEFKRKFFEYLQELFDIIYGKENHHLDPEAMLQVNYEILNSIKNHDVKEKVFYNVVTKKESIDKLGFDWSKFALALGYKKVPDFFISDSLSYVKSIMNIINAKWKTPAWISWWKYLFIKNISRFHKGISHIYFNFSRKYVQGISSHMPTEIGPIFIMSLGFDKAISEEYVKRYRSQKVIDYVNNIAENIRSIFIKKIKRNTWLTPKTKAAALMKLEHIKFVIGDSANGLHDDPDIKYSPIDPWGNLTKIYLSRLKKYIDMEGKSSALLNFPYIDLKNLRLSGRQIYIVNAFYTPAKNDIYIPLAYLQKPFVDLDERGIEYNLAYIGFTIGHELAHSLDNTGSKFDYTGKLVNWWSPQDFKIYNQKLDNIKKQYVLFAKRDGVILDPNLSIGENCADIIGVSLCEEYLQDFQLKNDDVVSIKYLSFKGYYNYVAIQMRQVISKKALKAQAGTNPHPPDKYRVNVPLSRLKIFKSIYNIKKTDKMYWHNHDVIW